MSYDKKQFKDRKGKILFLSDSYSGITPWLIDGKEPAGLPPFYQLVQNLILDNYLIYMVYPSNKKPKRQIYENLLLFCVSEPKGNNRFLKLIQRIFQFFEIFLQACMIIFKYKPQIIYSTGYSVIIAAFLKRIFGINVVARIYGTFLYQKLETRNLKNLISALPEILVFKSPVDSLIITNDGTRGDKVAELLNVPHDKVKFWINGVDKGELENLRGRKIEIRNKLNIPQDFVVISSVGRIAKWKRIDLVVKIYAEMIKKNPKAFSTLLIIGDGSELEKIKSLTHSLGIDSKVYFIGKVAHKEALEYIVASDILLFFYEHSNVGNVLLEALTLGKAVICRNTGDTSNFVIHNFNGILVSDGQDDDVILNGSNYLCELINNPCKREKLSQNAIRFSEDKILDWDLRIKKELDEIQKLMSFIEGK